MIVLSLVLVIVAAVLLVVGVFDDGTTLIYWSIGACLAAMGLLGIGVLLRRRGGGATAVAGYGPGGGAVATSRSRTAPGTGEEQAITEPTPVNDEESEVTVFTPERGATSGHERQQATNAVAAGERTAVRRTSQRAAAKKAAVKKVAVKKTAAGRPATSSQTGGTAASEPTARTGRPLREVKGLGPARLQALLQVFGSEEAVRAATVEQLASVKGISANLARAIKDASEE